MKNEQRHDQAWVAEAVRKIEADYNRSADTHLFKLNLPALENVSIYLKDESSHPTGSLKHRLARSLFLYGLCNGWIHKDTTVIEASSGSTAVSEAYFSRLLGLKFIAVMPKSTSPEKIAQIAFYGGKSHLVESAAEVCAESQRLAAETGGHFMDQFTYAERATDWRGNNNIAESIFAQLSREEHPVPTWLVCGAGTGGTSATLGRYARYKGYKGRVCVVDPESSVFFDYYRTRNRELKLTAGSRVEGIGRPRVEPSFIADVVDHMIKVPDAATMATLRFIEKHLGIKVGGSTGTNLYGVCQLAAEMVRQQKEGSIVTLICDGGTRYLHSYHNPEWIRAQGYDLTPYEIQLNRFAETGEWKEI